MEEIKTLIEKVSNKTFEIISNLGNEIEGVKTNGTRIIFPKKRDSKIRISEQELKQIFIEQFNAISDNYYYSIETPTQYKYLFKGDGAPKVIIDNQESEGQSALIDMTIHNNKGERIAIIEFKALNPEAADYCKDFVKLSYEPEFEWKVARYFIHLVDGCKKGTLQNLIDKKYSCDYVHDSLDKYDYRIVVLVLEDKSKKCKSMECANPKVIVICK